MIPNLVWTAVFLIPIAVFCYTSLGLKTTYVLVGVSLIPVFFPNAFFDRIQLSRNARWYKKIGVKHINRFAQNGSIFRNVLKKKYPRFKVISKSAASIKKQYHQTYFFEKFHFSLFLFFIIVTIYAVVRGHFYWAVVIIVCNLLYNIYPNLLQQYIRIKLKSAVIDKQGS